MGRGYVQARGCGGGRDAGTSWLPASGWNRISVQKRISCRESATKPHLRNEVVHESSCTVCLKR
ncbi:hypothetical protein E2C01_098601 [Portunus trituberculatus]|uniref:Uncharacterized protein n=1 Tax=Portunus trituberculatus TaxID=210409 RepID=A0A5B7KCI5_PORTR|nr:hypothetical protein [Portunus trituberculatus]